MPLFCSLFNASQEMLMPLPTRQTLDEALTTVRRVGKALRGFAVRRAEDFASGAPSTTVLDVFIRLGEGKAELQAAATVAGLAKYAKDQFGDPDLDVAAEYSALITAIDAARQEIAAALPTANDGGVDYLLVSRLTAGGPVDREFSAGELASARAALQAVAAAIEA